jgi:hypothetical protein
MTEMTRTKEHSELAGDLIPYQRERPSFPLAFDAAFFLSLSSSLAFAPALPGVNNLVISFGLLCLLTVVLRKMKLVA